MTRDFCNCFDLTAPCHAGINKVMNMQFNSPLQGGARCLRSKFLHVLVRGNLTGNFDVGLTPQPPTFPQGQVAPMMVGTAP